MKSLVLSLSFFGFASKILRTVEAQATTFSYNSNNAWRVPDAAKCIVQSDFEEGTLIINKPGAYKLCENITFKPNPRVKMGTTSPSDAFVPDFQKYDPFAYGIGFFAAISIIASDVQLYLNGFTIQQSKSHNLMQRFYANIELASSPFIATTGPHEFVSDQVSETPNSKFHSARNVRIQGPGVIGRSSHHGIHGNENQYVTVDSVTFQDFEVAAVSLNKVDTLEITNCDVIRNSREVPVNGMFSAAHFISAYGKYLKDNYPERTITFGNGVTKTSTELYDALVQSIQDTYSYIIMKIGSGINPLYKNQLGIIDGPCYAFLVHGRGPAVDGFGTTFPVDTHSASSDVNIINNRISNLRCWSKEIPAAVIGDKVVSDAVGAVFQFVDSVTGQGIAMNSDGTYKGNVVADMQIFVAKAIHDGIIPDRPALQTGKNQIPPDLVDWATTKDAKFEPQYRCNGDSMHHVAKGVTVIRVEATRGFMIKRNQVVAVVNQSFQPFNDCHEMHQKVSEENAEERQIGNVRGISVSAFRPFLKDEDNNGLKDDVCVIRGNTIRNFDSENGHIVIGIDVQGESQGVSIVDNTVRLQVGVSQPSNKYIACRVREQVSNEQLLIDRNNFKEELVVLNDDRRRPGRRNLLRALGNETLSESAAASGRGGTSGCPFLSKK